MSDNPKIYDKNIDFIRENGFIDSLMLMVTYSCQLDCRYCDIIQEKAGKISPVAYKKAVGLLLGSRSREVTLRFFGGEPFLYPELLLEIMNYAEKTRKKESNKKIKYLITTNGLNLDENLLEKFRGYDMEIMFSFDGRAGTMKKNRTLNQNRETKKLTGNLKNLGENKVDYFVNMLVTPDNADKMVDDFKYIASLGASRIQVCYQSGVSWDFEHLNLLLGGFSKIINFASENKVIFMNIGNDCEPVMLSSEIIVDIDGKIFHDIAIFHERVFPQFRRKLKIGNVFSIRSLDEMYFTKKQIYKKLVGCYRLNNTKKDIIVNNIQTGLVIKEFWDDRGLNLESKTESGFIPKMLGCSVREQMEMARKADLKISHYLLRISNGCLNDCLFCKNKKVPITSLEYVRYKISDNLKKKWKKICLVGNEPLNHPKIMDILELCNSRGFKEIQIMTSGMFLKDKIFLHSLYDRGMRSVSLPIYSLNPKIHDMIVQRRGDYEDLMQGIENLKKYPDIKIYIHTNLIRQNVDEINRLEEYVKEKITPNFCVLPVRCKLANLEYGQLIPRYSEIVKKVKSSSLVGLPLCILEKIQGRSVLKGKFISDAMKIYLLDQNYFKPDRCSGCQARNKCVGTFKDYISTYGSDEICPIKTK
jgi:sulfatase maturation enzyme AslB (radical SAM superfamily)